LQKQKVGGKRTAQQKESRELQLDTTRQHGTSLSALLTTGASVQAIA
jgi:hypothetical protein